MAVIPRGAGPTGATGAAGAAGPNSVTSGTTTTNITGLILGNGATVSAALSIDEPNLLLNDSMAALSINYGTRLLVNATGGTALNYTSAVAGTLTAFAGVTLVANTLTIGTGAGTVSQTAFAANTFPARASTGNLEAKTVTDAALSVLDDTTVADMRTTLGGTTVGQAIYTKANPSALSSIRVQADNSISFVSGLLGEPTEALAGSYHLFANEPPMSKWQRGYQLPQNSANYNGGFAGFEVTNTGTVSTPGLMGNSTYYLARYRTQIINTTGGSPVIAESRCVNRFNWQRSSGSRMFSVDVFRIGANTSSGQGFTGYWATQTAMSATQDLTTLVDVIGMAYRPAQSNWYLIHNDGSGATTEIDLGANFPVSTTSVYRLWLCSDKNSSTVAYQVDRLDSWQSTSGSLSTNIPALDQGLAYRRYQSNGSSFDFQPTIDNFMHASYVGFE